MKTVQRSFCLFSLFVLCAGFVSAQNLGDYRSVSNGDWDSLSTWQAFNGNWVSATVRPDSNAGRISILAGDTVTITKSVAVDSLEVLDGGSLVVSAFDTLVVGDNPVFGMRLMGLNALVVHGVVKNFGNIVGASANRNVDFDPAVDTACFKSGGLYDHARNGGTPIVAKWETGSTYKITGVTANYPNRVSQNFYHFVWNCPNQTRSDGQVNFYRTRVRGDITILSNGTTWGHDRDIRMCDNFPTSTLQYTDTVWIDGNIYVRKAPAGQFSRLALNGGGNTNVLAIVIVKGNVVVEDSCVFGRANSQTDVQLEIGGNLTVAAGGMIYNGAATQAMVKNIVFTKQGTATLAIADGTGAFNRGATVVGPQGWKVASGCTLDIGTSKIDSLDTGMFVIENGGAVKVTYGANSGKINCRGDYGLVDLDHMKIGDINTANGNSFIIAKNVDGTGTITYTASAIQNVSDPTKAIARQWYVAPSPTIKSADLDIRFSPYDIPSSAKFKNFVAMKYTGLGPNWLEKGPVNLIVDELFGDTTGTTGANLSAVTDLVGTWSVGEKSLAQATVVASTDSVQWRLLTQIAPIWGARNVGNVVGDSVQFSVPGQLEGNYEPNTASYLARSGSWGIGGVGGTGDPDSAFNVPRIDWRGTPILIYPGQSSAGWPANATDTLNNVWIQFKVTPAPNHSFKVRSIAFDIAAAGNSTMRVKAYISTDPTFATKDEILAPERNLQSYVFDYVRLSGLDYDVAAGKSFYLRIYPWQHDQSAVGTSKRLIVKRVLITGDATTAVSVEDMTGIIPAAFKVYDNYPNPFNPTTNIRFDLPAASYVTVKVFNLLGQEVASLFSGHKAAGTFTVPFDAAHLSSGVYLYRVEAGAFVDVKRMILLK